jgi:hypothetical protein
MVLSLDRSQYSLVAGHKAPRKIEKLLTRDKRVMVRIASNFLGFPVVQAFPSGQTLA